MEECKNTDCAYYCSWEDSKCSVARDISGCECKNDVHIIKEISEEKQVVSLCESCTNSEDCYARKIVRSKITACTNHNQ